MAESRNAGTRKNGEQAELANLEYQGQMVAQDEKRTYWTRSRIKSF